MKNRLDTPSHKTAGFYNASDSESQTLLQQDWHTVKETFKLTKYLLTWKIHNLSYLADENLGY